MAYDWLTVFIETLPRLRNEYAHGTQMLHASVLVTFQIVSDLIDQLWSRQRLKGEYMRWNRRPKLNLRNLWRESAAWKSATSVQSNT